MCHKHSNESRPMFSSLSSLHFLVGNEIEFRDSDEIVMFRGLSPIQRGYAVHCKLHIHCKFHILLLISGSSIQSCTSIEGFLFVQQNFPPSLPLVCPLNLLVGGVSSQQSGTNLGKRGKESLIVYCTQLSN